MRLSFLITIFVLTTTSAFATDGRTTECFDMAVAVPSAWGSGESTLLPVDGTLCVEEKNMQPKDEDGILETGDITVTIRNGKGQSLAVYRLNASSSEGAAGKIHTSYAASLEELEKDFQGESVNIIKFHMRNDHIARGEFAGVVDLERSRLVLIQK